MQEVPLTLDLVLRRLESVGREVAVAAAGPDGVTRTTWGEVGARARRVAGALDALGVPPRGRVATLAWSGLPHLELFYGVPCADRVLHTLNARLRAEQLAEMAARCEDEVLFVGASLTPLLEPVAGRVGVREVVVIEDGPEPAPAFAGRPRYEQLLAAAEPLAELPPLREEAAVCVCHTTGTSGRPKGVAYSNRSVVLHALGVLSRDGHGVSSEETVLPLTPMFHLMAWGLPYSTALAPTRLVLPGADTSPAAIAALVESERVTMAAGVPTFWARLAGELDGERDLSSLRRVLSGGAAAPRSLVDRYLDAGIEFVSSWGMTESGSGTCLRLAPGSDAPLRQGPRSPASSCGSSPRTAPSCPGTTPRSASCRRAAPGSPAPTSTPRTAPTRTASTAAGCAPATSPRSTPAAASASSTGSRTWSSPAASGSPRPSSRSTCSSAPRSPRRR